METDPPIAQERLPIAFERLIAEVKACQHCKRHLPLEPRPLFSVGAKAKILIVGQAPGRVAHTTSLTWNDSSGDRLRAWLNIDRNTFYDGNQVAIVPMGLCYPGKGKTGDLPPRPECAPLWHAKLLDVLPDIQLKIYVGAFSFAYYLGDRFPALTHAVKGYRELLPTCIQLPHPSPRNGFWLKQNPWFEQDVVPSLQNAVKDCLSRE